MRAALVLSLLVACGSPPAPLKPEPMEPSRADTQLATQIETFIAGHLAFRPNLAIDLGLHEHDGKVPDRSAAAVTAEIARLETARTTFEAFDPAKLGHESQVDREVVLAEIRKELFSLSVRRRPQRDPFYYLLGGFSLNPYIAREYAPAEQRAAAMLRACETGPAYYQQAAAQLEAALPAASLQVGLMMSGGVAEFVKGDAKKAFAALPDDALRGTLDACLDRLAGEIGTFQGALKSRMPAATPDFRLGADQMIAMLRATEGIEIDVPRLVELARADYERNKFAIEKAAHEIDPKRDAAAVIAEVSADKPAADRVLEEATGQIEVIHKLIADKLIVSVPRADNIVVRTSPQFMRGNFASFSGAGQFESAPLPSFYYIAPPDPTWPASQQQAYLPSRTDLLFISAHEVSPGHFLQGVHQRASKSRVRRIFETYTSSEGWAHYVEEMMWEQGLGGGDPRAHIGQLKNALLRNVRFLVALGYHTEQLSPEDATGMFLKLAYADPANAKQQAMRGTVDPMFLGYTLGKLIILELRADWQRANPGKSLREFHDQVLSYGEAPLPVIRRMMLGAAAGPPLRKR